MMMLHIEIEGVKFEFYTTTLYILFLCLKVTSSQVWSYKENQN